MKAKLFVLIDIHIIDASGAFFIFAIPSNVSLIMPCITYTSWTVEMIPIVQVIRQGAHRVTTRQPGNNMNQKSYKKCLLLFVHSSLGP